MRCGRSVAAGDRHRDLGGKPRERRLGRRELARLDRIVALSRNQIDSQSTRDRDRCNIERRPGAPPGAVLGIDIGQAPIAFDRDLRPPFDPRGNQIVDELGQSVLEAPAGAVSVGADASPLRFSPDSSLRSRNAVCSPTNSSIETFASR